MLDSPVRVHPAPRSVSREHGSRAWAHLHALPMPRWHIHAAKLLCVQGMVVVMSVLLLASTLLAVFAAGVVKPAIAAVESPDLAKYFVLLGRIFLSAWLLLVVQLWVALHYSSFVPALAPGMGERSFLPSSRRPRRSVWYCLGRFR